MEGGEVKTTECFVFKRERLGVFFPFTLVVFILAVGLRSRFLTTLKKEDIRKCSLKGKRNFDATSDMRSVMLSR